MIGRVFLGRYETRRLLGEGGMGRVYLARQLDLGRDVVVKVMHEHIAADTNVDFAVGTPGYICPEQVRGEEMDHRGDIYSVGVMMYELLTGRLPFTGPTSMDILLAHATEYAPSFAELGLSGWVPREVEQLVMDCLAKDPENRPQSARDLAERFETALARAQSKIDSTPSHPGLSSGSRRGLPDPG